MFTVTAIFLLGWFIGNYQGKKAVKEDRVVIFKDVLE